MTDTEMIPEDRPTPKLDALLSEGGVFHTEPLEDKVVQLDLDTRKAITGLRKLLLNPGECHLFTRYPHKWDTEPEEVERWLSDRYVMLNVTDSLVIKCPCRGADLECEYDEEPDGMYKLTAGKGLQPLDLIPPDTADLLKYIEKPQPWYPMYRTRWAMADDDARKMLCYAEMPPPEPMQGLPRLEPLAINEGIWAQLEEHFRIPVTEEVDPNLKFEYAPGRPYRVSTRLGPVAYVATADFPQFMREQANAIVQTF